MPAVPAAINVPPRDQQGGLSLGEGEAGAKPSGAPGIGTETLEPELLKVLLKPPNLVQILTDADPLHKNRPGWAQVAEWHPSATSFAFVMQLNL